MLVKLINTPGETADHYLSVDTITEVKVYNDTNTISYTTTDNATYYARYETAYTLNVSKIDEETSASGEKIPLAGAEFTLYRADEDGDQTITYNGTNIKCFVIGSATSALTDDRKQALAVFSDSLLPGREYYLVETKPPFGYNIITEITQISFAGTEADENGVYTIEIKNRIGIRLPVAGGVGTLVFGMVGALLIGTAVLLFISKKKFSLK